MPGLFFIVELATRRIEQAGTIRQPHGAWMLQVTGNLLDSVDGFTIKVGGQLIVPPANLNRPGPIVSRERLGGLLRFHDRKAARNAPIESCTLRGRPFLDTFIAELRAVVIEEVKAYRATLAD